MTRRRTPPKRRSILEVMDDAWFRDLETASRSHWSEDARAGLRGVVFYCWQEMKKTDVRDYASMVRTRRHVSLKANLLYENLVQADSNFGHYIASLFGHASPDQTLSALQTIAQLNNQNNSNPKFELLEKLIVHVVQLLVEAGGTPTLSKTGKLGEVLRIVHEVLPDELRYDSAEGLIDHAEYIRPRWQKAVARMQS